ncbi:MAG: hypothetical protein LBT08_05790 [Synergistaceae bacterium]|nr:hypothetical protein [Synergistaceae bacterium]
MKKLFLVALLALSFAWLLCQTAFVSRAWAASFEYSTEFSAYPRSASPQADADGYAISLTAPDGAVLQMTVKNTGTRATGSMTVILSGTDAGSFTLSKTSISSLAPGGSDSFTISTKSGLGVGTYNATVTVGNSNVSKAYPFHATLSKQGESGGGCDALGGVPLLAAFLTGLALLRAGKSATKRKG